MLKIDGNLEGETQAAGQTEYIEVEKTFFLGNLKPETLQLNVVKNNLQVCKIEYVMVLFDDNLFYSIVKTSCIIF